MLRRLSLFAVIGIFSAATLFMPSCSRQQEARSQRPPEVQRWEYKMVASIEADDLGERARKNEERFNALGADGWEFAGSAGPFSTFKRPKR